MYIELLLFAKEFHSTVSVTKKLGPVLLHLQPHYYSAHWNYSLLISTHSWSVQNMQLHQWTHSVTTFNEWAGVVAAWGCNE